MQPLIALFANEPPARIEQHFEVLFGQTLIYVLCFITNWFISCNNHIMRCCHLLLQNVPRIGKSWLHVMGSRQIWDFFLLLITFSYNIHEAATKRLFIWSFDEVVVALLMCVFQESRAAFEDMNQSFENGAVRHQVVYEWNFFSVSCFCYLLWFCLFNHFLQEEFWEAGAKPRDEWIKWIYPKLWSSLILLNMNMVWLNVALPILVITRRSWYPQSKFRLA